jgi:hypothetical protein
MASVGGCTGNGYDFAAAKPYRQSDRRLLLLPQMIHDVGNFVDAFHRLLAFVH